MDSELFKTWLSDVFVKHLNEKVVPRPVVLFVDGHSTHLTMEASDICLQNGVILYCLLEHASHLMQPCDLRFFGPLKEYWKQATRAYSYDNIGEAVTKQTFARVFKNAWLKSAVAENAQKGIRDAGLYPYAPEKVLMTAKMEPSKVFVSKSPSATVTSPAPSATVTSPVPSATVTSPADGSYSTEENAIVTLDGPTTSASHLDPIPKPSSSNTEGDELGSPDIPEHTTQPELPSEQASQQTSVSQASVPTLVQLALAAYCNSPKGSQGAKPSPVSCTPSASSSDVLPSTSSSCPANSANTSTVFDEILKLPQVKTEKKKTKKPRVILPKAVTSQKFRDIMNERKAEKERAEKEKLRKQMEREKKRKEKEIAAKKRAKAKALKQKSKPKKLLILMTTQMTQWRLAYRLAIHAKGGLSQMRQTGLLAKSACANFTCPAWHLTK